MNENQKLGTIMKELIRFSLPLILSGVLQQLYNWADAFIVGNVDGELSLSAIGVTSIPISFFITTITAGGYHRPRQRLYPHYFLGPAVSGGL